MPNHDIVAIGGSAGALKVLEHLLADLPGDLPASLFIVLHIGAAGDDILSGLLDRVGPLPCATAVDGARFQRGHVYVAPPDRHLLLDDGRLALRRGPRENMARPAIDPLLRSAAIAYGPRVIGVLLSGNLYDGTAGLRAIQRCGGTTIVQDPADALHPEMPQHALDHLAVDHRLAAAVIAERLIRLVAEPAAATIEPVADIRLEARLAAGAAGGVDAEERLGELSPLTCPECGGSTWEIEDGGQLRYRCHAGHSYDARLLLNEQAEVIDRAMWSALRAHEERGALLRRMAAQARGRDVQAAARRWDECAAEHDEHAQTIRRYLMGGGNPGDGPSAGS